MPAPKRPRLDAVLRHIENGSYDDEIDRIIAAVEGRREARQEAVRQMVKEVYGEDFDVVGTPQPRATVPASSPSSPPSSPERPKNPFLERGDNGETAEWMEAEKRAREEEEALRAEGVSDDDVSNSPVIGSIDVGVNSAEGQET